MPWHWADLFFQRHVLRMLNRVWRQANHALLIKFITADQRRQKRPSCLTLPFAVTALFFQAYISPSLPRTVTLRKRSKSKLKTTRFDYCNGYVRSFFWQAPTNVRIWALPGNSYTIFSLFLVGWALKELRPLAVRTNPSNKEERLVSEVVVII